jgi:hypothetical protein
LAVLDVKVAGLKTSTISFVSRLEKPVAPIETAAFRQRTPASQPREVSG